MVVRSFQASQIPWCFRPPGQSVLDGSSQTGIWLQQSRCAVVKEPDIQQEPEETDALSSTEESEEDISEGSEDWGEGEANTLTQGAAVSGGFGVLSLESESESGDSP